MTHDDSLRKFITQLIREEVRSAWNFDPSSARDRLAFAEKEKADWLAAHPGRSLPKKYELAVAKAKVELQKLGVDDDVGYYMEPDDKDIDPLLPEKLVRGSYKISDIEPCQWYLWPKDIAKKSKKGFKEGGGPGEEWLAYLFNGQVQGSRKSYDIAIHPGNGGGKYEVKEIPSRTGEGEIESGEIRLGTEGMQAMRRLRLALSNSTTQMANFLRRLDKDPSFTQDIRVAKVQNFISHNKTDIVDSGEVTQERAMHFVATLRACRSLLARPPADVDPDVWNNAVGVLKHDLFKSDKVDLNRFHEYVSDNFDVTAGFTQVDGVFVVAPGNDGGFIYIPKDRLRDVFVLTAATQGYRPKFKVIPKSMRAVSLPRLGVSMTSLGLVPMSAKPFHVGHYSLVRAAAAECDEVIVFVSVGDRRRPGEIPILGSDMEDIWRTQIEKIMPENVTVAYGANPVRQAYERLIEVDRSNEDVEVALYAGLDDAARFNDKELAKAAPRLYESGSVRFRSMSRSDSSTVNVSGTAMRKFIASGDRTSFTKHMPPGVDAQWIWRRLRRSAGLSEARTRLSEDDAGGNPAWGPGGDLTPGMIGPYGIEFGDANELISTFVSPFVDVFKTAVAGAKEISVKAQTLVWTSLQTVLTTLIPIYGYRYGEVFEKEKERVEGLRSQYSDVFARVDSAFKSNDAAALAFMMAPGFVISRAYGRLGADVVKGLFSVVSGGRSDKIYDDFKEKADALERWISSAATGEKSKYDEGLVREAKGDITPEKVLRSNKFMKAALSSSRAKELSSKAAKIHKDTLGSLVGAAKEVLGAKDVSQLVRSAGKKIKPDVAKKIADIGRLPPEEQEKATQLLMTGVKKGVKDFYVKSLTDVVDKVKAAGIPEDAPFVQDYRKAIASVKSM